MNSKSPISDFLVQINTSAARPITQNLDYQNTTPYTGCNHTASIRRSQLTNKRLHNRFISSERSETRYPPNIFTNNIADSEINIYFCHLKHAPHYTTHYTVVQKLKTNTINKQHNYDQKHKLRISRSKGNGDFRRGSALPV